eukprot:296285-Hanusia_phi.AAC.1
MLLQSWDPSPWRDEEVRHVQGPVNARRMGWRVVGLNVNARLSMKKRIDSFENMICEGNR